MAFFPIKKINLYCCYIHIFNIFLKLTSEKMRFSWVQRSPTGKPLSLTDLGTDQNGELNTGGESLRSRTACICWTAWDGVHLGARQGTAV